MTNLVREIERVRYFKKQNKKLSVLVHCDLTVELFRQVFQLLKEKVKGDRYDLYNDLS